MDWFWTKRRAEAKRKRAEAAMKEFWDEVEKEMQTAYEPFFNLAELAETLRKVRDGER